MKILDTHAHYDDEAFDADREAVIASLPSAGVETVVNMGASLRGAYRSLELAKRYGPADRTGKEPDARTLFPGFYAGCGIHPDHVGILEAGTDHGHEEADGSNAMLSESDGEARAREAWDILENLASSDRCVTVGEIGLDYHWMVEPREIQQKWFIRQLELAVRLGKPINVHSRNAAQDTYDIIMKYHAGTTGGIIHCYSGSAEMARGYTAAGYCLGIGGAATYPHSKTLKKVIAAIPIGYLVTETDSPYMAPEPVRGSRNNSANIRYVIRAVAQIKGMEEEEAARILYENGRRVYRLKP